MEENKNNVIDFGTGVENTEEPTKLLKLDDLFGVFSNDDQTGVDFLGMVLSLPDEEFNLMSELILAEFEKSFKNSNDRFMLAKTLESSGVDVNQIIDMYGEIIEQIDGQLKDSMDQNRRDFLKRLIGLIVNAAVEADGSGTEVIQIPIQLLDPDVKLPSYARDGDAGMDVCSLEDYDIEPGKTQLIRTGLAVAIPEGYEIQVRPRSGLSLNSYLRISNSPGTIDSGYRDEIGVIAQNIEPAIVDIEYIFDSENNPIIKSILHGKIIHITKGQKIAQIVLNKVGKAAFYQVESVKQEAGEGRGGGFGHTGI